jgi:hypothetical protein
MDEEHSASQVSWGARINTRERQDETDCPAWVRPADRDRWVQKGLIVWQKEVQHIIRLSASQGVQLLDGLRTDDEWPEEGITIGEPVTRIPLKGPEPRPEPALYNPIGLSPRQTKSLLRLLRKMRRDWQG